MLKLLKNCYALSILGNLTNGWYANGFKVEYINNDNLTLGIIVIKKKYGIKIYITIKIKNISYHLNQRSNMIYYIWLIIMIDYPNLFIEFKTKNKF